MSSSYLSLCQKFRREVGVSGTGPSSVTGQSGMFEKMIYWIADADEFICSQWLDWGFLHTTWSESTIASTKDYTKPSDLGMWDVDSFYLDYTSSTYKKLQKLDYWHWRDAFRNGSKTNAKPDFFIIKPDLDVILESPPDAVYTLTADYYKATTRLTDNTDTSPIPTRFDRIIIARAKMYYAEHEDAPEVMEGAVNEYQHLLTRLESLYLRGQTSRTQGAGTNMVVVPE